MPSGSTTLDNRAPTGLMSNHVHSETPARDFDHDIGTFSPSSNLTTTRNFCLAAWCKENKKGTPGEFNAYWAHLEDTKDLLFELYKERFATAKSMKKQASAGTVNKAGAAEDNPDDEQ
ncbi:hypothetical protein PAXRUDRAFT_22119 [Paxillus rubicundulus Ve08.2h10]|uniref:Uncharacterized protein n=1 Tax=Paxillus rubicundulus Ve08.2h10 TaxID=930991 RepID=A0A0D0C9N1_9AGAM|nr:hypothetical protein PAXRUDRAFT_22119 [Paxillus rubicundulus Ve08.2h10]